MELKELILSCIDYLKLQPIVAIIIIVVIAVLFYFKKKAMLKLLAIFLALAFLFYLVTLFGGLTSTGVSQKEQMIEKSQQD